MASPFDRALLLFRQSRYELAEKELRRTLSSDPDSAPAHALLALCLSERKRPDEARHEAGRAIALAPDEPFAHRAAAGVLLKQGRLDEADAAIHEAIRLDPSEADHFALLASLRLEQRLSSRQLASDFLAGLGVVAVRRGQPERAVRLGGAAKAQRRPLSSARSRIHPAHRTLQHAAWDAAQAALGTEPFAAMWAEGQALSLDAAVALGLGDESTRA